MGLTSLAPSAGLRRAAPWGLLVLALAGGLATGWQSLQQQRLWAALKAEAALDGEAAEVTVSASSAEAVPAASGRAAASAPAPLAANAPPELRFARAQRLAARGQLDAALGLYRALQEHPVLGAAARFNAANALLRQAMALREAGQADPAYPMVELAKEGYRELLRRDPDDAAARYNLERALRLNPELEPEDLQAAGPARGERAASTMRAISQGLP